MNWAQMVVILLGFFLVAFVVAAIILVVQLFKLTKQIKTTSKNAERTVHIIEDSVGASRRNAASLMVLKGIVDQAMKQASKKDKKPNDI